MPSCGILGLALCVSVIYGLQNTCAKQPAAVGCSGGCKSWHAPSSARLASQLLKPTSNLLISERLIALYAPQWRVGALPWWRRLHQVHGVAPQVSTARAAPCYPQHKVFQGGALLALALHTLIGAPPSHRHTPRRAMWERMLAH